MPIRHVGKLRSQRGHFSDGKARTAALLLGLCGTLLSGQAPAQSAREDGWLVGTLGDESSVLVGGGGILEPDYEGAKSLSLSPVPLLEINGLFGGHVFVSSIDGIGINVLPSGPLKFSVAVNYSGGRDDGDHDRLRGTDDIDGAALLSTVLEYDLDPFSANLEISHRFGDDSGTQLTLGAAYGFSPLPDLQLSFHAGATFADGDHENAFFGVTPSEAARASAAGNPLRAYKAGGGLHDVGLKLTGTYSFDEHWLLQGQVGVSRLLGDAADSPLTERELQPAAFLGLAYRF